MLAVIVSLVAQQWRREARVGTWLGEWIANKPNSNYYLAWIIFLSTKNSGLLFLGNFGLAEAGLVLLCYPRGAVGGTACLLVCEALLLWMCHSRVVVQS